MFAKLVSGSNESSAFVAKGAVTTFLALVMALETVVPIDLICEVNPLALLASEVVAGVALLLPLNQLLGELSPAQPDRAIATNATEVAVNADLSRFAIQVMPMTPSKNSSFSDRPSWQSTRRQVDEGRIDQNVGSISRSTIGIIVTTVTFLQGIFIDLMGFFSKIIMQALNYRG